MLKRRSVWQLNSGTMPGRGGHEPPSSLHCRGHALALPQPPTTTLGGLHSPRPSSLFPNTGQLYRSQQGPSCLNPVKAPFVV
ncbi:hypothetical protein UPYG_G00144260 [Umbra pygmaea]|uniref:Uncharacterized protein n=1 Tax=Umbra pygmaea TaxID=75934 RepID=A0ABD0XE87_UMBPY